MDRNENDQVPVRVVVVVDQVLHHHLHRVVRLQVILYQQFHHHHYRIQMKRKNPNQYP
jgi:hypothetical protein